jgi:hypothetical protein
MLEGSEILQKGLQYSQYKWVKWLKFLKLSLTIEEWFHNSSHEVEVDNAKPLIGEVLQTLQALFPREDKTNGYCIPKMHGMTKFQPYMKRFGSSINFYGGLGEAAHKFFVKAPGQKTPKKIFKSEIIGPP